MQRGYILHSIESFASIEVYTFCLRMTILSSNHTIFRKEFSMWKKIILTNLLFVAILLLSILVSTFIVRPYGIEAAINTVNEVDMSDRAAFEAQRSLQEIFNIFLLVFTWLFLIAIWHKEFITLCKKLLLFFKERCMNKLMVLLLVFVGVMLIGCKPPNIEIFEEVETYETAFVVPMEGDVAAQAQLDSAERLREQQVSIKRIPIPRRWHKQGRQWNWFLGQWIPTVRVIKVDRRPITQEWTAETASGTSARDQAIWVESSDSVGFSVGFTCTAFVQEKDAALFLYQYSSQSLAEVMDTEVRARIQMVGAEIAARYNLNQLRSRKQEIIDAVRDDAVPFFAARGITITTIGMFGGFAYESPGIQQSIDAVFVAQQEEEVSLAELTAQRNRNQTIEISAQAQANAVRIRAEGEASAIRLVAEAAAEAQDNPSFMELRRLEVEQSRIGKWNGAYPTHLWTTGNNDNLGIIVQSP